jgi:DNA-binding transcriptional LysR family regulator
MRNFDGPTRRLKTSELEVIVAIATSGSLGRAALQLACTQSRVSYALGEVERVLGMRLFHRSRTGTVPTEAGAAAVSRVREILQRLDSIAATGGRLGLLGVVRIAAYRSVATHLLIPAVLDVNARHRRVSVEIDDACDDRSDVERSVRDGRADLGVVHQPVSAGFAVSPFAQDRYVAVVRADCRPTEPRRFWEHVAPLPLFELRCSGARAAVEACRRDGMKNRTVATFASDSTIIAQVGARRGLALLPRLAAEPLPAGLVAVMPPIEAVRSLMMIRRNGSAGTAVLAVQRTLVAALRGSTFTARRWLYVAQHDALRA